MAKRITRKDQQKSNLDSKKRKNDEFFKDKLEGNDYVVCKECGFKASQMSKHVKARHNLTPEEYYTKHSCDKSALMSKKYLEQLTARALTRNPSKGHGGKYSAHSVKFFKYEGLPADEVQACIAKVKTRAREKRLEIPSNTTIEYWLNQTGGNLDEARKLQSKRQHTFSLGTCILKYGEAEGKRRWVARQEKWSKSFTASGATTGVSTIGREFVKQLPAGDTIFCSASGGESSITIHLERANGTVEHRTIRPDYVDYNQLKVIEFFGDYFHANPIKYAAEHRMRREYRNNSEVYAKDIWERDEKKSKGLQALGYKVHIVWENDYRTNPEKVLQECLDFLTS